MRAFELEREGLMALVEDERLAAESARLDLQTEVHTLRRRERLNRLLVVGVVLYLILNAFAARVDTPDHWVHRAVPVRLVEHVSDQL